MAVNRIAYFLAGAVLGAAGVAVVRSGKGQELLSGLVQGGYGLTEGVMARMETLKEDIEDYMAEARYTHEQKVKEEVAREREEAAQAAAAAVAGTAAKPKGSRKPAAKAAKAAKSGTKPASKSGAKPAKGAKSKAAKPKMSAPKGMPSPETV
ncbi:DUF6110 family protein [Desulfovibrio psychrotolerans]|uniref:Uncharacterized protein n=1 Tax=Desulfovibrio psychrotolerans TaxID=415242 RepID=A0A7J0BSG5_9BACT|nr:hypothetical protein [Desulfovibrio psychrotolerans]GFM36647.1 hypothetical protein DSM19430T_13310 [Desulfovibrio psychrotolerans]